MQWKYNLLNPHEFKPQLRSWDTAICKLLHISGDSSAIVWNLYSSTTQNLSVWWTDSTYRLTNIVIYDRCSTSSTLCCWKESRQLGIRTIFRALFGFWMKFLACLTVSVTVLIISAGRRSTETHRCSFICLLGQCILKLKKGHWVWEESWLWLQLATRLKPLFNKAWV